MADITQTITVYSGTVPDASSMTQGEFDSAAVQLTNYWQVIPPELNAWSGQANGLKSDVNAIRNSAISETTVIKDQAIATTQAHVSSAQSARQGAEDAQTAAEAARDQTRTYRDGANLYATAASQAQTGAQTAQANAQQAATAAEGYASLAQATNPDTPIRVNPNAISEDFTLTGGYNGASVGPIEITLNTTVTVVHNSAWSVL